MPLSGKFFDPAPKMLSAISFEVRKVLLIGHDRDSFLAKKEMDHIAALPLFGKGDGKRSR